MRAGLAAIAILILILLVPATRYRVLSAAGRALVVDDPVTRAEVIVVPQWTGTAGALAAADLVRRNVASRVAVLPEALDPAEQELKRRGLSQDRDVALIELLGSLGVTERELIPNTASGTEAEGELLPAWSDAHGYRSIVVVSVPDHARRVARVLRRSMAGRSTRIAVHAARYSSFDPDGWWKTRAGVRTEVIEMEKLLLDVARHPFS
jgi:hypothetical protein